MRPGCKATSGGSAMSSIASDSFGPSSEPAFSAARRTDSTATSPNQWRALGVLPVVLRKPATKAPTSGTSGWSHHHSIAQVPAWASRGTARMVSSSNSAPPRCISRSMPNWVNCFMQLICASPPMLFSSTLGL